MNKANYYLYSFFGLIIFQLFMSLEEIIGHFPEYLMVLTSKVHRIVSAFPVINLNDQTFLFFNLLVIVFLIFAGIVVFLDLKWSRILAVTVGCIEILNGGFHIAASIFYMVYIPGLISSIGVIIFGFLVIYIRPSFEEEAPAPTSGEEK